MANSPLSDTAGLWLQTVLHEEGLTKSDYMIFNTVLCSLPEKYSASEFSTCSKHCQPNILAIYQKYRPSVVGVFGPKAARSLAKQSIPFTELPSLQSLYGSVLNCKRLTLTIKKIVATYNAKKVDNS